MLGEMTCDTVAKRNLSTTYDETGIIMNVSEYEGKSVPFRKNRESALFFLWSKCLQLLSAALALQFPVNERQSTIPHIHANAVGPYLLLQLPLQLLNDATQLLDNVLRISFSRRQLLGSALLFLQYVLLQIHVLCLQLLEFLFQLQQLTAQLLPQLSSISCSDACERTLANGGGRE